MKAIARVICMSLLVASPVYADGHQDKMIEGKQLIASFAAELKGSLQAAIKQGGLVNGVEACSIKAGTIALSKSNSNWTVSRTSLKPRNPDNAPSSEETMVLLNFERQLQSGIPASELLYTQTKADGSFMMMKAIPAQGLCLSCHGQNISADVQKVLSEKYPQDKAVGYKEGEIRGAFSLTYTP